MKRFLIIIAIMFAANVFAQNKEVEFYKTRSEIMYVHEYRDTIWVKKKLTLEILLF